jgi:hypothetical protein
MNIWEIDKVFLFLVLVLPGFVSIKVYSNLIASDKIDFSKSLVEAICFSALNFGILAFPISYINSSDIIDSSPVLYWLAMLLIFVIFPAVWPFVYLLLIRLPWVKKIVLGPHKQPWDSVFSQKESMWVVVTLKSGEKIRGKYDKKSYASVYPSPRQIYLEELWLKDESGGFGKKAARSKGIILHEDEIKYIEFYN